MSSELKKICIVEDNKSINKLYSTLLKKSGYTVEEFFDGKSAYDWIKENKPLCVVLDILLPDMSGPDLLSLVRELPHGNDIPVIAVTGFAHGKDKDQFLTLGFNYYISKPINTQTFVSQVEEVISKQ